MALASPSREMSLAYRLTDCAPLLVTTPVTISSASSGSAGEPMVAAVAKSIDSVAVSLSAEAPCS